MQFSTLPEDTEDPDHSPAERSAAASQSTWVSVAVNLVLTSSQIAAGIVSKSQGLNADGIHSLSDLVADFVVLFANHHSQKDAALSVEAGHDIAVEARNRVMLRHRVLNLMTHVDPWRRPDLDHEAAVPKPAS